MRALYVVSWLPLQIAAITASSTAFADPRVECQTPCRIITLNADEEKALLGQNMVFDTAVQGRAIDLGGVVTYFRTKITAAPMGDVKILDKPKEDPAKKK